MDQLNAKRNVEGRMIQASFMLQHGRLSLWLETYSNFFRETWKPLKFNMSTSDISIVYILTPPSMKKKLHLTRRQEINIQLTSSCFH